MKKLLSILIILCLVSNLAFAGEIDSSSKQSPQTAYERLMSITGPYSNSRETMGKIGLGFGFIFTSYLMIAGILEGEFLVGLSIACITSIPAGIWGYTMVSRNTIAKRPGEIENLQLREKEALRILSKKATKAKVNRYLNSAIFGSYVLIPIIFYRDSITVDPVILILGGLSVGLSARVFLIKSKWEREYNAYLKDKGLQTTYLIPIITPKYSGIMVAKRF